MILSVHATFGAAVASLVPNHPVQAFTLGFISHLVLDSIPHRDYDLISVGSTGEKKNRTIDIIINKFRFIRDIVVASFDGFMGIVLAFLFFFNPDHPWIFLLGAFGALLPDILVFFYLISQHKSLSYFYDFHGRFDSFVNIKLKQKLGQVAGIFLQFCTLAVLIAIIFGVKSFFNL